MDASLARAIFPLTYTAPRIGISGESWATSELTELAGRRRRSPRNKINTEARRRAKAGMTSSGASAARLLDHQRDGSPRRLPAPWLRASVLILSRALRALRSLTK